jgi:hypothetical protein
MAAPTEGQRVSDHIVFNGSFEVIEREIYKCPSEKLKTCVYIVLLLKRKGLIGYYGGRPVWKSLQKHMPRSVGLALTKPGNFCSRSFVLR